MQSKNQFAQTRKVFIAVSLILGVFFSTFGNSNNTSTVLAQEGYTATPTPGATETLIPITEATDLVTESPTAENSPTPNDVVTPEPPAPTSIQPSTPPAYTTQGLGGVRS